MLTITLLSLEWVTDTFIAPIAINYVKSYKNC